MGTSSATNFNSFEIAQTGITSVAASAAVGTYTTTVAHNLGYTPVPMAFLDGVGLGSIFSNAVLGLPTFISSTIAGGVVQFNSYLFCAADVNNAYFMIQNGTGVSISSFLVKFYLLRERATN